MISHESMLFASFLDNDLMPAWIVLFGSAAVLLGSGAELFGKSQEKTKEEPKWKRSFLWTGFTLTAIGMLLTIVGMVLHTSS